MLSFASYLSEIEAPDKKDVFSLGFEDALENAESSESHPNITDPNIKINIISPTRSEKPSKVDKSKSTENLILDFIENLDQITKPSQKSPTVESSSENDFFNQINNIIKSSEITRKSSVKSSSSSKKAAPEMSSFVEKATVSEEIIKISYNLSKSTSVEDKISFNDTTKSASKSLDYQSKITKSISQKTPEISTECDKSKVTSSKPEQPTGYLSTSPKIPDSSSTSITPDLHITSTSSPQISENKKSYSSEPSKKRNPLPSEQLRLAKLSSRSMSSSISSITSHSSNHSRKSKSCNDSLKNIADTGVVLSRKSSISSTKSLPKILNFKISDSRGSQTTQVFTSADIPSGASPSLIKQVQKIGMFDEEPTECLDLNQAPKFDESITSSKITNKEIEVLNTVETSKETVSECIEPNSNDKPQDLTFDKQNSPRSSESIEIMASTDVSHEDLSIKLDSTKKIDDSTENCREEITEPNRTEITDNSKSESLDDLRIEPGTENDLEKIALSALKSAKEIVAEDLEVLKVTSEVSDMENFKKIQTQIFIKNFDIF